MVRSCSRKVVRKGSRRDYEERSRSVSATTPAKRGGETEMRDLRSPNGFSGGPWRGRRVEAPTVRCSRREGKGARWCGRWLERKWARDDAGVGEDRGDGRGWSLPTNCRVKETKRCKGRGIMFRGSMQSATAADCLAPRRNDSWIRYCLCLFARCERGAQLGEYRWRLCTRFSVAR